MKTFIHTPRLNEGGYPAACPFNTTRAGKTRETLATMGLLSGDDRAEVEPVALERPDLERFHTVAYLDVLERVQSDNDIDAEAMACGLGTPDCPVFPGLYDYVRLAAGGTVTGARLILDGRAEIAFNPSGGFHHAMPGSAAGFCYLNDVALACDVLAEAGKRVCFLDIDVHHSDGVQHGFYERSDVLVVSTHESGKTLFPGTGFMDEIGTGEGKGYTVNVPLPVGTYDTAFLKAYREAVRPVMRAFEPDVLIVELGMDALAGDPLAHLHLTNNAHAEVLEDLLSFGCPILATGGGGYHIENTVRGWALSWSVLCGDQSMHDDMSFGMGGVMLENTDWHGGLRDRMLLSDGGSRGPIDDEISGVVQRIKETVFPVHGM